MKQHDYKLCSNTNPNELVEELLYLIEFNNNIIGAFNNLNQAETYIFGCFQNNFMTLAKIKVFKLNSCYSIETKVYNSDNICTQSNLSESKYEEPKIIAKDTEPEIIAKNNNIIKKPINDNDDAFLQMAKQKIDLQHKINMLKIQKEKMEESKRVYENDLKLFELFNESKQTDASFVIPELFKKKYEVMFNLKVNNNLTWETFIKEYHIGENNYDDYFGLNNYEELFLDSESENNEIKSNNNFSEELDIETESSTESSDSDLSDGESSNT